MNRRQLIASLSLALGTVLPGIAGADAPYPSSPVKVLVGFPPGTATDVAIRVVTESMAKRLQQPFVVENRAGAGSNIAARALVSSPPDGYTLFVATIANTINAAFPNSSAVDPVKDFMPVTMIGNVPNVLVAHPSLDAATVPDLIKLAKARPGNLSFASSGIGTSPHLSGELFSLMAGVKMVHVPYRGSTPAVTDLLGGQVHLMFAPASSVMQHVRAGKLKALAVTSTRRTAVAPDLPTLDELGLKGFDTSVWIGLVAPARTPPDVAAKLRAAAHSALDSPEVENVFKAQGIDVVKTSQDEFSRHLRSEATRWSKVIQTTGIKPE
jgi:tripartite-type tricarboxylate transporter receptor subunit TctC